MSRTITLKSFPSCFIATLMLLTSGCGHRVAHISLHDTRLPVEARRWLADAEDEVAIAQVELEAAQGRLEEAHEFKDYVNNQSWARSSGASAARQRLQAMVEERLSLGQMEVAAARVRITLADALLVRSRAETAMQHDLAAYDLEPIIESAEEARSEHEAYIERLEQQRAALDQATTGWWEAYGAYIQSGGESNVLWVWENE